MSKDDRLAGEWARKAAEQGVAQSQALIGAAYADGDLGLPNDNQMAYFWLLLASVEGKDSIVKVRDEVEARLTPKQRAAAQADARNWKPRKAAP